MTSHTDLGWTKDHQIHSELLAEVAELKLKLDEQIAYSDEIVNKFHTLHSEICRKSCEMLGDDGEQYMVVEIPEIGQMLDDVEIAINQSPAQSLSQVKADAVREMWNWCDAQYGHTEYVIWLDSAISEYSTNQLLKKGE